MITAVVWSKDRACQLDLLLTSLERNAPGVFSPKVLYRSTSSGHEHGYDLCRSRFPDVHFQFDGAAPAFLARLLIDHGHDHACFFTDDSVLYRELPFFPKLDSRTLCFSLRLGKNTTWCYPLAKEQALPRLLSNGDMLRWHWTDAEHDFSYPASVDGHVFRSTALTAALRDCPTNANPNQIEEHLVKHFERDRRTLMAAYPHSCLVGIPVNTVSTTHRNRHGEQHSISPDFLLASYLRGERIDLDALDFSDVRGAHQEIELVLT